MAAWAEVFRNRGIELEARWFQFGIGMVDLEFYGHLARAYGLDPTSSECLDAKHETFARMIQDNLPLVGQIQDLLERLKPRYPMAMATSSSRSFVDLVLKQKNWTGFFQATLSRNEITHPKPNPEIYIAAARALGFKSEECVAVEDSTMGLASACSAGLKTIAITTNFAKDKLQQADLVIDNYRVLMEMLSQN